MKLIMENWKKFLSERVELEDLPIGPQPLRLHKEANAQIILAKDNPGLFDRSNDQFWSEDPGKIEYYKERGRDITQDDIDRGFFRGWNDELTVVNQDGEIVVGSIESEYADLDLIVVAPTPQ